MNLSPYPEYTKQTKCNNNYNNFNNTNDFFRPIISNESKPLFSNHENYIFDNNNSFLNQIDIERSSISSRNKMESLRKPVQNNFQNNYYTTIFENNNLAKNDDINIYLTRNPINTRRDTIEKERNKETKYFMQTQGGPLLNFIDIKYQNTRKDKIDINSSNYVPMPKTMAIPKENI